MTSLSAPGATLRVLSLDDPTPQSITRQLDEPGLRMLFAQGWTIGCSFIVDDRINDQPTTSLALVLLPPAPPVALPSRWLALALALALAWSALCSGAVVAAVLLGG